MRNKARFKSLAFQRQIQAGHLAMQQALQEKLPLQKRRASYR